MASAQGQTKYSEPSYAKSGVNVKSPFYLESIDKYLFPETQKLLEDYSGIPRAQQSKHVHEIRDQAWATRAYPCTGLGVFLVPYLSYSPAYSTILARLKAGATFLDVGCLMGGDMRRLAFDGAPSDNMVGLDIASHWDIGYRMYRDQGRFRAKFVEGDILADDAGNEVLSGLRAKVDVLSVSAVLHQWDWKGQVECGKRLAAFMRAGAGAGAGGDGGGAMVVGYQIGRTEAMEAANPTLKVMQWKHDPASFARMWDEIGAATGTSWETQARLRTFEELGWDPADMYSWMEPQARVLDFVVIRKS